MASPTLKVEIAFTSDPLDTTPTWVDVSQYVRATSGGGGGVYISRGHRPEVDRFEAGSCRVTLSNRDRRFDPSHAAGPNFGNLIPRKQIRVTATWAAVDYPMFTGNVTGWPQDFSGFGEDATVTIEAVDRLALLSSMDLPDDLVYGYANDDIGNLAFFLRQADVTRWHDAVGTFGSGGTGFDATPIVGTPRVVSRRQAPVLDFSPGLGKSGASLAPGMSSSTVVLDGSTVWQFPEVVVLTGDWSYSFWVQTLDISGLASVLGGDQGGVTSGVNITAAGFISVVDVGVANTYTTPIVNNGIPHHVAITAHSTNGVNVYVDGVISSTAPVAFFGTRLLFIGSSGPNHVSPLPGSVQDLAVFDKALSYAEVEQLYNYSRGYFPESSADRVTRLLDDAGWPAAWRDITTTERATVGELVYDGALVLPKLREVERSEQGMLFADSDGNIAFRERYYVQEATAGSTVQQIFSDDKGATALGYSTFGFRYNDVDVVNQVSVTIPTTWASSSDATSITVNGRQSKKIDTILSTFDQANSMAAGLVAQGKDATYRVPPITVYPVRNDTRWDEVLALELGYRVGVEQTPMGVGSQNAQEVTLEHLEWSIVDKTWMLTIAGAPCFGVGAATGWFIVGSSLVAGPDLIGY